MDYRKEIDGLRAIAVVPVIFFHAGLSVFSGGFAGVDVFFVISGYLITSIILSEIEAGTFSLISFYERRARRILPALFVVMFTCLPFAYVWLYPEDLKIFSDSLIAVSVFLSNLYFWKTSAYFDTAAELKPLLHTWSLAVEEQYYFLFPILLMMIWKLGKRRMIFILLVLAIASFSAAQWGSTNAPTLSFYVLPTRAWELMIGVFVAFYRSNGALNHRDTISQLGSAIGLLLVAYSVFFFDKQTPFPSVYTLLPTFGTALIILYATPRTIVGQALGSRILVGLGLISYSAYLWHVPLFAFARHASFDDPTKSAFLGLSALSLVLAYLTWKYVELPFRRRTNIGRKAIFSLSGAGLALFILIGLFLSGTKTDASLTAEQRKIYLYTAYDFNSKARAGSCFLDSHEQSYQYFSNECRKTDGDMPTLLLWGDSHAAALSVGLRLKYRNVIQYTASACPPVLDRMVAAEYCAGINEFVLNEIERLHPGAVILDAYWYSYGSRISDIANTVAAIRLRSPDTRITIVGNVPLWPGGLPLFLIKRHIPIDGNAYLHPPLYSNLKALDDNLASIAATNGARFLSALDALCVDQKCLTTTYLNGSPALTSFDIGHLTEAGSLLLASKVIGAAMLKP